MDRASSQHRDIHRSDFAANWNAPNDSRDTLKAVDILFDKALVHMSWWRVESEQTEWDVRTVAQAVLALAESWRLHYWESNPALAMDNHLALSLTVIRNALGNVPPIAVTP